MWNLSLLTESDPHPPVRSRFVSVLRSRARASYRVVGRTRGTYYLSNSGRFGVHLDYLGPFRLRSSSPGRYLWVTESESQHNFLDEHKYRANETPPSGRDPPSRFDGTSESGGSKETTPSKPWTPVWVVWDRITGQVIPWDLFGEWKDSKIGTSFTLYNWEGWNRSIRHSVLPDH